VALAQEKPTAGPQQPGHGPGPPADVGQPAQRADAGEHQVEHAGPQRVDGVVDVGADEVDVGTRAGGQTPGLGQRGGGEVEAGHPGTQPRQRDGVGADVALQVHPAYAGEVAQPRDVEPDDGAEVGGIGDEALDLVVPRRRVRGSPLVPAGAVDRAVVVAHPAILPGPGPGPCASPASRDPAGLGDPGRG
jgi:hypothetical protein